MGENSRSVLLPVMAAAVFAGLGRMVFQKGARTIALGVALDPPGPVRARLLRVGTPGGALSAPRRRYRRSAPVLGHDAP